MGPRTLEREIHPDLEVLLEEKLGFLKDSKKTREDAGIGKENKFRTC